MAINFNPSISSISQSAQVGKAPEAAQKNNDGFGQAVSKYLNGVNEHQEQSNTSIADLLTQKNADVDSVVASVAKADVSFKLLVGVRNKLVAAYKETMKMQI